MTAAANQILKSFDELPDAERREVYVEICRRAESWEDGDWGDIDHDRLADELFVELDRREANDAKG